MKFKSHIIMCFFILAAAYGELVAPLNGTNLRAVHVLFEWDQEPDASNYNLQVSNSAQFNNVIL